MAIVALSARAQVKCHVIGTVADGTVPSELVICKDHTDPKDSPVRLAVNNGRFEYDIEESQIEKYNIVDFGEVLEKGMTSRLGDFFVEDGATITIHLDGDEFQITSNDAPEILALLQSLWSTYSCAEVAKGVLAASDLIWGEDLNQIPDLTEMLTEDLEMIQRDGMRGAVEKVIA